MLKRMHARLIFLLICCFIYQAPARAQASNNDHRVLHR